ncbi:MAG: aminodeoxychorismate synthase component I, partial [Desulfatitalea sp.]|nr:aminodeoxychorismate synthase component I [Desulfatitalea sp.]NNK01030.1 aminodeoxychorismate synthase component I [Desulfatitalea sp.]
LAYDLKDELERLPRTSVDDLHLPHLLLFGHAVLVVHDRHSDQVRLMAPERADDPARAGHDLQRFNRMAAAPLNATAASGAGSLPVSDFHQAAYEAAVQRIIDYIATGDVYQVNLSQRFQASFDGDAFALFRRLFQENPAPFFAFVQAGDHQIISTSPERFLQQRGRRVETRPIKGTRPRGRSETQDQAMRAALAASAKDDAELSMIVDLLRNDLGKVCRPGSVRVTEHKRLEAYENVYHLVSIVHGELEAAHDSVDLLAAAFPGGSITGCPKVRAMEIIDELEPHRRHVYCGSIGYIGFHDTMDLSIAIRTAILVNGTLCFSVGGGIVFDSDPHSEYEETLHKGRTLLDACRNGHAEPASRPWVWHSGRLLPADQAAVSINDLGLQYGCGFFETIRVDQGTAPLLADHLARFVRSWHALMPCPPPDVTWAHIIRQVIRANQLEETSAAIKLLATRGSRDTPPWDHALLVTARPYVHRLAVLGATGVRLGCYPHPRQSPWAAHKTLNYLFYYEAGRWAAEAGFDEALILNPDGTVSETHTANLLIINGRQVIRPTSPAVLPGVMAAALCRILQTWGYTVSQAAVSPNALLTAEQVLAANALMGAVPVIGIDQTPRTAGSDLWRRLNDAVLPAWRNQSKEQLA